MWAMLWRLRTTVPQNDVPSTARYALLQLQHLHIAWLVLDSQQPVQGYHYLCKVAVGSP